MSRNIVLMGMMGAGKSTVAGLLADRLSRRVVDTDEEIERWRGRSIPEIFAEQGEEAFREHESAVIEELASVDDLVISLGGGAVLDQDNVDAFLLTGVLVYLEAGPEVLVERLQGASGRPLLAGDDLDTRVHELHDDRSERYEEVAEVIVDGSRPPEEVVDQIVTWLLEHPDVLTPSEYERLMR